MYILEFIFICKQNIWSVLWIKQMREKKTSICENNLKLSKIPQDFSLYY